MLLKILLLNLVLCLTNADADAESSPLPSMEDWENFVEKLKFRLRDMETRMEDEKEKLEMRIKDGEEKHAKEKNELEVKIKEMETKLEAKDKEMETRLEAKDKEIGRRLDELEDKLVEEQDELGKRESGLEASIFKPKKEVDSEVALTKPVLRDLPIIIISAWQSNILRSRQTVTFKSFLANYNNGDRPGGGDGVLDLDSGVFTCFTPGFYTVSFSAYGIVGPTYGPNWLFLYKNGVELPESKWYFGTNHDLNDNVGVTGSRILVLHLDAGDRVELRITHDGWISDITLNIELTGSGFDFLV